MSVRYQWRKDDISVVYSCSNWLEKCHKLHEKDDTSVRYQWRKDDTSVVYSAQIGDNLVMPYTITSIRLLKEYTITVKIKFFLFQTAPERESVL